MKLLFEKIQCEKYKWNNCGHLNVSVVLLGHLKFCCLLWEWESTDTSKKWPKQASLIPGQKNVVNIPLIKPEKVNLPLLHIKAMDQNGAGFAYFKNKFPSISDAKIKEGVFLWPKIRELIWDT
jgi:hypothetical protein